MSGEIRNLRDGILDVGDAGSAESITLALDSGDLSWTETLHPTIQILDRGKLDSIRKGDEVPVTLTFSIKYQKYGGDTVAGPTLRDALTGTGGASGWTSAAATEYPEGFACELVFSIDNVFDGSDSEKITFDKFVAETLEFAEGDEFNTLTASGYCFVTAPTFEVWDNS